MKLAILLALTSTTSAALVTEGCIEVEYAETNPPSWTCTCHGSCKLCGYTETSTTENDCITCKSDDENVKFGVGKKAGKCTAKTALTAEEAAFDYEDRDTDIIMGAEKDEDEAETTAGKAIKGA